MCSHWRQLQLVLVLVLVPAGSDVLVAHAWCLLQEVAAAARWVERKQEWVEGEGEGAVGGEPVVWICVVQKHEQRQELQLLVLLLLRQTVLHAVPSVAEPLLWHADVATPDHATFRAQPLHQRWLQEVGLVDPQRST